MRPVLLFCAHTNQLFDALVLLLRLWLNCRRRMPRKIEAFRHWSENPLLSLSFLPTHQWTITIVFIFTVVFCLLPKCSPKVQNKNCSLSLWNPVSFRYGHFTHTHTQTSFPSLTPFGCGMIGATKKTPPSYRSIPLLPFVPKSGSDSHCSLLAQAKENLRSRFQH